MPGADAVLWVLAMAVAFATGSRACGAWRVIGAAAAAAALGAAIASGGEPVPFVITTLPAYVVGRALRDRRLMAERLQERARELEAEREAYARLSVRYERARIAAELHDIVAHAISVMVVQAAAGQRLAAVDPELTTEAFAAIGDAARQAEADLERLVALLADEEPMGEAPDLRLVEDLVARAAGSGLDVTLDLSGDREGLPARTVQAAYRVVQESLTNALRYAAGSTVRISVRGDADGLVVEVRNGTAAGASVEGAGTGNGLRGLRERLAEVGGALDAGPTGDGGWSVRARLPRRAAVTSA